MPHVSIIIPANNEAAYIGACLQALVEQATSTTMVIVVSANACRDNTVEIAKGYAGAFAAKGHSLHTLDRIEPGKLGALNAAEDWLDTSGNGALPRIYLDADVICQPELIDQIAQTLDCDEPRYATGTLVIAKPKTLFTKLYARFWAELPFVKGGGVGAGFFAVNAAGRGRWGKFPDIISDDTFVRINFAPSERVEVPSGYVWPMIEGFKPMVKVRQRQDAGVEQLVRLYPDLISNEGKSSLGKGTLLSLSLRLPFAFIAYMAVHIASRITKPQSGWSRGR